tara:strand:+ start:22853 stop:26233 length:3381 start_codon:yes stop_codon:yes gene_type:complete
MQQVPQQIETYQQTVNAQSWTDLPGAHASLNIAKLAQQTQQPMFIITPDMATALRLERELDFFAADLPHFVFPDWETLPYDNFSPHQDIISARLHTLQQLPNLKQGIVIAPIQTLMQRIAPADYIMANTFVLEVGMPFLFETMRGQLVKYGYRQVSQVLEHGEFAVRGSIIDIYPMGTILPLRIDLFDDEIENLRSFDPETQRSVEELQSLEILPAHEFPLDDSGITHFRQQWRSHFEVTAADCPIYRDVSDGQSPAGIEYYLPLFFDETASVLDYVPSNTTLIQLNDVQTAAAQHWQQINNRYEQRRYDTSRPILAPADVFFTPDSLSITGISAQQIDSNLTDVTLDNKAENPLHRLQSLLNQHQQRVLITAETSGRREALFDLLNKHGIKPTLFNDWNSFIDGTAALGLSTAALDAGAQLDDVIIIAEAELYGEQVMQRRLRKTTEQDSQTIIRNLAELAIDMPVVHIEHGIGRYKGLQVLDAGGLEAEYLCIEYADNNKLYVPVANLHLISRYSGADTDNAPLNHLGTDTWQKAREKAAKRAYDVAAELLEIHAQRASKAGFSFTINESYENFANAFPFEETPDQQQAIEHVVNDMKSDGAMDRLICGDVGFGKTEVAMRAAFIAVQNGKQVAILVPTTLLAQQHFESFQDRFTDSAVTIDLLSRFRSASQQTESLANLENAKTDIIIGTHKLIQDNIKFKNLGLLVIDEEHRFGVRQKEKLKALRAEVDILTLTATPIPRTLNMALSDVRDLSIIATPPAKRLSIKTFVQQFDWPIIREAISRELARGGQVYYLHNNVDTIANRARDLQELIPEAKVGIGHGQMREKELEHVMSEFYHQRYNILICTTIIETGIDVPSANTIIMERADKFGLAQLHQLRGRVGRSHHQAYAYLLTPEPALLSRDAQKRLDAISSLEDLGMGFTLATHDMEIRGAGEFLGDEQSGQIHTVGFSLYMEFLERAVESIKSGTKLDFTKPIIHTTEIDLGISALIPDDYLPDIHTRLVLYKRIASAKSTSELKELQVEIIDRFGLFPEQVKNLFAITEFKLLADTLGMTKITCNKQSAKFTFDKKTDVDPMKIINLIQQQRDIYKMEGPDNLRMNLKDAEPTARITAIRELLEHLM